MGQVVALRKPKPVVKRATKQASKKPARRRSAPLDPRHDEPDRVFEIIQNINDGEFLKRVRVRLLRPGGLKRNIVKEFGVNEYLVGMVSEPIGIAKWTPETYGGVLVLDIFGYREIVEPLAQPRAKP